MNKKSYETIKLSYFVILYTELLIVILLIIPCFISRYYRDMLCKYDMFTWNTYKKLVDNLQRVLVTYKEFLYIKICSFRFKAIHVVQ